MANIILAKQLLKEANVYKAYKSDHSQGGLGGLGIENWIVLINWTTPWDKLFNEVSTFHPRLVKTAVTCSKITSFLYGWK